MQLTRRQEEFIRKLLDLTQELQAPVHYTELAERIGVSRFTAYDMLRVLEEKGMVRSEYRLDEERSGPGRSTVVYLPTDRARRLISELFQPAAGEDWEATKDRILSQVQRGEWLDEWRALPLAEEMLARMPPDEPAVVRYCTEVMTVLALRLRRHQGRRRLLRFLPDLLPTGTSNCRPGLNLLAGFTLGLLAEENDDEAWHRELLVHVRRFSTLVLGMEADLCRRLSGRLHEAFAPLRDDLQSLNDA